MTNMIVKITIYVEVSAVTKEHAINQAEHMLEDSNYLCRWDTPYVTFNNGHPVDDDYDKRIDG